MDFRLFQWRQLPEEEREKAAVFEDKSSDASLVGVVAYRYWTGAAPADGRAEYWRSKRREWRQSEADLQPMLRALFPKLARRPAAAAAADDDGERMPHKRLRYYSGRLDAPVDCLALPPSSTSPRPGLLPPVVKLPAAPTPPDDAAGSEAQRKTDDFLNLFAQGRLAELRAAVEADPRDEAAWLALVAAQDDLPAEGGAGGPAGRAALARKKLAVLETALAHNPRAEALWLAMADLAAEHLPRGYTEEVVDAGLRQIPGSAELWLWLVRWRCANFVEFTVPAVRGLYQTALRAMAGVEPPSEEDLLRVVHAAAAFERNAGYTLRCLAIYQALTEANVTDPKAPGTPTPLPLRWEDKMRVVELFWLSEAPRIGEPSARTLHVWYHENAGKLAGGPAAAGAEGSDARFDGASAKETYRRWLAEQHAAPGKPGVGQGRAVGTPVGAGAEGLDGCPDRGIDEETQRHAAPGKPGVGQGRAVGAPVGAGAEGLDGCPDRGFDEETQRHAAPGKPSADQAGAVGATVGGKETFDDCPDGVFGKETYWKWLSEQHEPADERLAFPCKPGADSARAAGDPESVVLFADVEPYLFPVRTARGRRLLVDAFLSACFGVPTLHRPFTPSSAPLATEALRTRPDAIACLAPLFEADSPQGMLAFLPWPAPAPLGKRDGGDARVPPPAPLLSPWKAAAAARVLRVARVELPGEAARYQEMALLLACRADGPKGGLAKAKELLAGDRGNRRLWLAFARAAFDGGEAKTAEKVVRVAFSDLAAAGPIRQPPSACASAAAARLAVEFALRAALAPDRPAAAAAAAARTATDWLCRLVEAHARHPPAPAAADPSAGTPSPRAPEASQPRYSNSSSGGTSLNTIRSSNQAQTDTTTSRSGSRNSSNPTMPGVGHRSGSGLNLIGGSNQVQTGTAAANSESNSGNSGDPTASRVRAARAAYEAHWAALLAGRRAADAVHAADYAWAHAMFAALCGGGAGGCGLSAALRLWADVSRAARAGGAADEALESIAEAQAGFCLLLEAFAKRLRLAGTHPHPHPRPLVDSDSPRAVTERLAALAGEHPLNPVLVALAARRLEDHAPAAAARLFLRNVERRAPDHARTVARFFGVAAELAALRRAESAAPPAPSLDTDPDVARRHRWDRVERRFITFTDKPAWEGMWVGFVAFSAALGDAFGSAAADEVESRADALRECVAAGGKLAERKRLKAALDRACKEKTRVSRTYHRAVAEAPYSAAVWLGGMRAVFPYLSAEECRDAADFAVEKDIRLRSFVEEHASAPPTRPLPPPAPVSDVDDDDEEYELVSSAAQQLALAAARAAVARKKEAVVLDRRAAERAEEEAATRPKRAREHSDELSDFYEYLEGARKKERRESRKKDRAPRDLQG
ncbi:Protein NRDE2-like protein [Diplonema papillatum]|nr:Protein NRDE2-like protein [Diplonema papillatum]